MMIKIRNMNNEDLNTVLQIQFRAYHEDYHEGIEAFETKLNAFPPGCWIAEVDNCPVAYLFSYPSVLFKLTKLDSTTERLKEEPNCYYIHDLAVDPEFKSRGIGKALFNKAKQLALELKLKSMALISVQNSQGFWNMLGFNAISESEMTEEMLDALYGYKTEKYPEAYYMIYNIL